MFFGGIRSIWIFWKSNLIIFFCLWPPLSDVILKSSADPYRVSKCKKSIRKYLPDCTHKTEFLNSFIYYSNLGFIRNEIGNPEGEDGSSSESWTALKKSATEIFFLSWIVTRVSCFRCTAYPGSQYHKFWRPLYFSRIFPKHYHNRVADSNFSQLINSKLFQLQMNFNFNCFEVKKSLNHRYYKDT
jgi:hypothetical protein